MDPFNEHHDIQEKHDESFQLSFLRDSEKDFWQQLVDSNIRASTIACLWCLKAHIIKKVSVAFNKWKLFSAIIKYESKLDESGSISKTPTSFANSDVSILNPRGTVNKALDNAIAVINRFKSISGDMDGTNSFNSNQLQSENRQLEFQSISADIMEVDPTTVPRAGKQKHLLELSKTLLDNGKDSATKRQILLQLSHDILDRAKSPTSQKIFYSDQDRIMDRLTNDHHDLQEKYYDAMANEPSPIAPAISNRSSLNALKNSMQAHNTSADFEALFPPEDQYYNSNTPHNHHPPSENGRDTIVARGTLRQRAGQGVRQSISQDEDFPYLKFRHGSGGDYVKDLVSPSYRAKSAVRPTTAASQSAKARSLSAGKSAVAAYTPGHYSEPIGKRRNISPQEKPRYLISTNASRKKVSSPSANPVPATTSTVPPNVSPRSVERQHGPPQHHRAPPVVRQAASVPSSSAALSKTPPSYPRLVSPQRIPNTSEQQIKMSKLDSTLAAIKSSQNKPNGASTNIQHHISSANSVSSIGGFSNSSRTSGISRTSKGSNKKDNAYRELSVLEYMERRSQNKGIAPPRTVIAPANESAINESTFLNSTYDHLDHDDIQNHLDLEEAVHSKLQDSFVHMVNTGGDSTVPQSSNDEQHFDETTGMGDRLDGSMVFSSEAERVATMKRARQTPKATPVDKMDKAQLRLLYGDLPDLGDAKRMWEKSLRR